MDERYRASIPNPRKVWVRAAVCAMFTQKISVDFLVAGVYRSVKSMLTRKKDTPTGAIKPGLDDQLIDSVGIYHLC